MNICNTILGFKYAGEIKNDELTYSWCRDQMPEHEYLSLVSCFTPFRDNFFDIGANRGLYSVAMTEFGADKIKSYAFEPQKECLEDLNDTIKVNGWENIFKTSKVALSDKNGISKIYFDKNNTTGASLLHGSSDDYFEIETIKLDDYCHKQNIKKIDFIKMDVEGHELQVLRGGEEIIRKSSPAIFLEILHTSEDKFKTIEFIENMGYEILILCHRKLIHIDHNMLNQDDMYLCVKSNHSEIIKYINNTLGAFFTYEPFKHSNLPIIKKLFNYLKLNIRYFVQFFIK